MNQCIICGMPLGKKKNCPRCKKPKEYKFTTMGFYEGGAGSLIQIVGRKSLFNDKEDFLRYCNVDCEEIDEYFDWVSKEEKPIYTIDDVSEGYVRYFPKMPESFEIECGYTFCSKGKGAFGVYILNM